jgi:hypothetical protein
MNQAPIVKVKLADLKPHPKQAQFFLTLSKPL